MRQYESHLSFLLSNFDCNMAGSKDILEYLCCLLINLSRKGQAAAGAQRNIIHKCIFYEGKEKIKNDKFAFVMQKLIDTGGICPSLYKYSNGHRLMQLRRRSDERLIMSEDFNYAFYDLLTPFCVALLKGNACLALAMLRASYVTLSDLTVLPKHEELRERIEWRKMKNCLKIVDSLSSSPPTLFQLAFLKVQSLLGTGLIFQNL